MSLQDDEDEEYADDFDKESSEDDKEEVKYFIEFGANQAFNESKQKVQVLSVVKRNEPKLLLNENPLLNQNKYFFWKREFIKFIDQLTSNYCCKEELEYLVFSFIKSISTFISLETALFLS